MSLQKSHSSQLVLEIYHTLESYARLFAQNNPLLAAELERVEKNEPFPPLDTTRYQVPAPSTQNEEDWRKALDNARSQLEHMKIRSRFSIVLFAMILTPMIGKATSLSFKTTVRMSGE